jgi:glycosyltransferase involved in cell wall biosynthesis
MHTSFSIVIPLYNKARFIERAIHSILRQTVQDFEILVVDDVSTDNSIEVVRSIKDSRIRLIQQETNRGVSAARNRGIAEAKYEWVAFLDADDEWKPKYLQTIQYLQDKYPGCGAYATAYEFHDENSRKTTYPAIPNVPNDWEGIIANYFQMAASATPIHTDAVVVARQALLEAGGFQEGISQGEDLLMWALIALQHPIAYKNTPFTIYQQNIPGQLTTSSSELPGKAVQILLSKFERGEIPEQYRDSLFDYLFRRIMIGARKLILFQNKGKEARQYLSQNPKKKLRFAERRQFLWLYLWSYTPGFFRALVTMKERIKFRFLHPGANHD